MKLTLKRLPSRILRKLVPTRRLPFNLSPRDRNTWPEADVLFKTDAEMPERQWVFHPKYQDPAELVSKNGIMQFNVKAETDDEWAYLYLDPQKYSWHNYSWQTTFRRITRFQEYAFNFRYVDFDNRYRYRFEDDLLFFDSKIRGKWRVHSRMPFPMALGAWYDLRIDAKAFEYRCYVNGMLMMSNRETSLRRGSIGIILWEIDRSTPAVAEVGPSVVRKLA
jgi:hypothetical protein